MTMTTGNTFHLQGTSIPHQHHQQSMLATMLMNEEMNRSKQKLAQEELALRLFGTNSGASSSSSSGATCQLIGSSLSSSSSSQQGNSCYSPFSLQNNIAASLEIQRELSRKQQQQQQQEESNKKLLLDYQLLAAARLQQQQQKNQSFSGLGSLSHSCGSGSAATASSFGPQNELLSPSILQQLAFANVAAGNSFSGAVVGNKRSMDEIALAFEYEQATKRIRLQQQIQLQLRLQQEFEEKNNRLPTVPCRCRGMPDDHNPKTAFIVIPEGVEHGQPLLCSHPICQARGVRFRYCASCRRPVAKRNFSSRHSHHHPGSSSSKNTTKKDSSNEDDDKSSVNGETRSVPSSSSSCGDEE